MSQERKSDLERSGGGDRADAMLRDYLREIARLPRVTPEEERELARRIRAGDRAALDRLVEANLLFVVSVAKKYTGRGVPLIDLINEGNVGLMEAAKRFEPERGVKFITYAVWWIKQALSMCISNQSLPTRLPPKVARKAALLRRVEQELASQLRSLPTDEQLAAELGIPASEVQILRRAGERHLPLAGEADGEPPLPLPAKSSSDAFGGADDKLLLDALRDLLRRALRDLDEREQQVLTMRFGLDGREAMKLREIGELLGLSRERIRQIEEKAIESLRRSSRSQQLLAFLN